MKCPGLNLDCSVRRRWLQQTHWSPCHRSWVEFAGERERLEWDVSASPGLHTVLLLSRPDRPMAEHTANIVRFEAAAAFWPEVWWRHQRRWRQGGKTLSSGFRQQREDLGMSPQKLRDYQSFLENTCVCDDTILNSYSDRGISPFKILVIKCEETFPSSANK